MKSMMKERQEVIIWEVFRRKFLSEYFPNSVKYAKEVEFLQLTQGNGSMTDYAKKFKHLSRFYAIKLILLIYNNFSIIKKVVNKIERVK